MPPTKQIPAFELHASPLEELTPGLTFQWLFDGKVTAYYAQNATRPVVDAWIKKIMEISDSADPAKPLFSLHDFSAKDCVITSYNQQRVREVTAKYPHLKSYSVTIVQQNLTMMMTRLLIRTMPNSREFVHLTFTLNDALVWLKKKMNEAEVSTS